MAKKKAQTGKIYFIIFTLILVFVGSFYFGFQQLKKAQIFEVANTSLSEYPFARALQLYSTVGDAQYLEVANFPEQVLPPTFTIEAWIKPEAPSLGKTETYTIIRKNIAGVVGNSLYKLEMNVTQQNTLPKPTMSVSYVFSVLGSQCNLSNVIQWSSSGITPANFQTWKHIAVIRDNGILSLYVNGVKMQNASGVSYPAKTCQVDTPMYIGANVSINGVVGNTFRGFIDEIRVSSIARYTNNFRPAVTPYQADESTILLYHFDDSTMDSGNLRKNALSHGNIQYVDSDIIVISSPSPSVIPSPIPKTSCKPRPACLDTRPACMIPISDDMCSPAPGIGLSNPSSNPRSKGSRQ